MINYGNRWKCDKPFQAADPETAQISTFGQGCISGLQQCIQGQRKNGSMINEKAKSFYDEIQINDKCTVYGLDAKFYKNQQLKEISKWNIHSLCSPSTALTRNCQNEL